jgi:hypothetical protein
VKRYTLRDRANNHVPYHLWPLSSSRGGEIERRRANELLEKRPPGGFWFDGVSPEQDAAITAGFIVGFESGFQSGLAKGRRERKARPA